MKPITIQQKLNRLVALQLVLAAQFVIPLSGRAYVYQAMRVTGSGDPRTPFEDTLIGKLPAV